MSTTPPTATPRTTAGLEWVRPAGNDSGPPNEQYVCADVARTLETELAAERAIVSRIWVQLGSPTYADLKGRSIYDLIDEMKTELARLRAELSTVQAQHLHEIDELAAQAKIMNALRAEVERLLEENVKLNGYADMHMKEKARAEKAEVELKQTQSSALNWARFAGDKSACADLAEQRARITERLWKEFITLMEITEESDSGNEFNPNKISSCRAMDGKRLNEILNEARQIVFDTPKE